jgi:hypothetical protein
MIRITSKAGNQQLVDVGYGIPEGFTYDKYATDKKGFWLKTSLSMKRFSKSHDIGTPS